MRKPGGVVPSNVVYIGLIPFDWDEETIKSVVTGSGPVTDVRLGYDYAGKNKGFCFIEYETSEEAQKAIPVLSQIKILTPGSRQSFKKLRIELSKEGFRANTSDVKKVLPVIRSKLPPNVQLPPEMTNGAAQPVSSSFQAGGTPPVQSNGPTPMPAELTLASRNLPQVQKQPFEIPDDINENLSKISPPQLIELIANLKNILAGPNSARAADVFQISPHLATAASQALLLMGFIDSDVITESMNNTNNLPPPPPQQQQQQAPQNTYGQYGQPPQQQQQQQLPPQAQNPYGMPFGQNPIPSSAPVNPKWSHLPVQTQAKLTAMAPEQADLVAQVLSLPADQISSLPADRQSMVTSIRAQYL